MIYGHIKATDTWQFLVARPAWRIVFEWLATVTTATKPGIEHLRGEQIYANVHGYTTLPQDQCRFESHRRYVDLQYCISGGEIIDWQLTSALQPADPFDTEKDLQFYRPAPAQCSMYMTPGRFAIFHPSDAHAPKRSDGKNPEVFKLVVKIDTSLV